jgi:hypothetical protein
MDPETRVLHGRNQEPDSYARPSGRSCPVDYRYGAHALAAPATLRADSLWIAGGLYGNTQGPQYGVARAVRTA